MLDESQIRSRIRTMLETGALPCDEPAATWAGSGEGKRCVACTETIAPTEVEFEVDLASGITLRLHRACYAVWREECEPTPTA
ncbi:MAG TPA: hypothetical protein VNN07_14610 [Candidatus Tectomicrobia bacterium]|nr:hypothetical protein [Candidatus Tectomicrobia bacterium]